MAHGLVQYISILGKVKNSALRYFYLNAEMNTSLGAAGYVCSPQIFNLFHNLDSCSIKIVYKLYKINVCFVELLHYFNPSKDFLKQL